MATLFGDCGLQLCRRRRKVKADNCQCGLPQSHRALDCHCTRRVPAQCVTLRCVPPLPLHVLGKPRRHEAVCMNFAMFSSYRRTSRISRAACRYEHPARAIPVPAPPVPDRFWEAWKDRDAACVESLRHQSFLQSYSRNRMGLPGLCAGLHQGAITSTTSPVSGRFWEAWKHSTATCVESPNHQFFK